MRPPNIVSIGGGTGLSTLLRGLKKRPCHISVIVTVTDDGGSSGRLREELGAIPPGDIRSCMIALSEDEHLMSRLFRYRFTSTGELDGHSFGNLFLSAMAGVTNDFAEAVKLTSEVLAIKGVIYPSTNSLVTLCAEMETGERIEGETRITGASGRIGRVFLKPSNALPLTDALTAIAKADIITIGPGSLYTSLIPNLLVERTVDAIERSRATRVYIQNIMTQPGETDGYSAADHIQGLIDHCGGRRLFSKALFNGAIPPRHLLEKYEVEGAKPVVLDRSRLSALGIAVAEADLLAEDVVIRHDPERLAQAVYAMCGY